MTTDLASGAVTARSERRPEDATDLRAGQRVALLILRSYQGARAGSVSPCRFFPSCSAYAVEAVERHGAVRGLRLAAGRISRCRPLGGHGVDLVPLEVPQRGGRGRRARECT